MRDQLVTAIGAILACIALYTLMFSSAGERVVTRPVSEEPGRNGYLALRDWLLDQDISVVSWRQRFDALPDSPELSERGNVMLTTLPHRLRVRLTERPFLQQWIEQGNTLLLAAALNDTPNWTSLVDGVTFFSDLESITGIDFIVATDQNSTEFSPALGSAVEPNSSITYEPLDHPLMEGVETLQAWSDELSSLWYPRTDLSPGTPLLQLAVESRYDTPAIFQLPIGQGFVIVVLSASMLSNHQIAESDAGQFIANIAGHHLGVGGSFVFDDMHQGLSSLYDPAAFLADKRLHYTLIFLMAAWFLYLVGSSNRVAPVRPDRAGPSQATLLAGIGGFMARRISKLETGHLLFEDWFGEIRRHRGIADTDAPPWQVLAATPTLSKSLLTLLQDAHAKLQQDEAVDLVELNNLIIKARKAIG